MLQQQYEFDDFLLQVLLEEGEHHLFEHQQSNKRFKCANQMECAKHDISLNVGMKRSDMEALDLYAPNKNAEYVSKGRIEMDSKTRLSCTDDSRLHSSCILEIWPPPAPFVRQSVVSPILMDAPTMSMRREYNFRVGLSLHAERMRMYARNR